MISRDAAMMDINITLSLRESSIMISQLIWAGSMQVHASDVCQQWHVYTRATSKHFMFIQLWYDHDAQKTMNNMFTTE